MVPLDDNAEQFEPLERHWVGVGKDAAEVGQELLQEQLVQLLGRLGVFLGLVDLLLADELSDVVGEQFQTVEPSVWQF